MPEPYRVQRLEERQGTWVPAPYDIEYVETLDEARAHAIFATIAIYAPGQVMGQDQPLEILTGKGFSAPTDAEETP